MVISSFIQQRASNQFPPLSFTLTNNACSDRKRHASTINGGKIPIFNHHLNISSFVKLPFLATIKKNKPFSSIEQNDDNGRKSLICNQNVYISSFVKLPFSGNIKKIKSFSLPATSISTSSSDEHDEDNGGKNSIFNQNLYRSSSVKLPFSGNIKKIKSFSNSSSSLICNHHLCISSFVKLPFSGKNKRIKSFSVPAVSISNTSSIEQNEDNGDENKPPEINNDQDLQSIFRRLWKVAAPYWSSDDKVQARLQLAAVFALTLGTTGISVGFNFLGRDFYNALSNKDQEQFTRQLLYYLGAFAGGIPVFVLRDYARETLSLRWRSWMTTFYMQRYLKNQTFYKIQSQSIIDNPDQRIVDDLSSFTGTALSFALILFNAAVDLVSFSNILYGIYPPLFLVLIAYSIGGTVLSIYLGRGLVMLNFFQEKKEADFRYGLVRVRENAESIAFYGGEKNEIQLLLQRFRSAVENLTELLIASRNLDFFTSGYRYLIQILPAAIIAPMYFSGKIEFGVINQSVSAFNHILGDISLIVYQFQSISAFSAVIKRLGEFDEVLDSSNSENYDDSKERIQLQYCSGNMSTNLEANGSVTLESNVKLLEIEDLTLQTPTNQATLIKDLSIQIYEKDHLLISGPSGSGKTSLLRALAGLWSSGKGKVTFYESTALEEMAQLGKLGVDCEVQRENKYRGVLFLPQKPYMTLGSLRQQLLYPIWTEDSVLASDNAKETGSLAFLMQTPDINGRKVSQKPTTEQLMQVLEDVRLGYILERIKSLDLMYEWSSVLSLGEQQRLAFARLLLSKPSLVLLDESTSALDEANEAHLYRRIEDAGITYISVGHRNTLYKYHKKVLRISTEDAVRATRNWYVEPINQESTYSQSRQ